MYILGVSCFFHDSAAVLINNDNILGAVQEERFTRKKNDNSFPSNCIKFLLKDNNITLDEIDAIIYYEKPFVKFERLIETYIATAPRGIKSFIKALPLWVRDKIFVKNNLYKFLKEIDSKFTNIEKIKFSNHHLSHAASTYYTSPFNQSLILTMDAVGEWATTSVAIGENHNIKMLYQQQFPHSIGMLYSSFTYYCGFEVNEGEYKLMGLAPYGKPVYKNLIKKNLFKLNDDGSIFLNMKYFSFMNELKMINKNFINLFGKPARKKNDIITDFYKNVAASIQNVLEEIILKICKNLVAKYKIKNICLSGGVALNCVANGRLLKSDLFNGIWVQPAAGDAGGALGAALAYYKKKILNDKNGQDKIIKRHNITLETCNLGPSYSNQIIKKFLDDIGANYKILTNEELTRKAAVIISEGNTLAWFQGRMEFGPRALGNRSIFADPKQKDIKEKLNKQIKFRESFRPFAPAILAEEAKNWFDLDIESPFMIFVANLLNKKKLINNDLEYSPIPAATHIDFSSRVQTVSKSDNPLFYDLLKNFYNLTGCPILLNTSFNIRGEPIVCSPKDAYNTFLTSDLDYLICGNFELKRNDQYK